MTRKKILRNIDDIKSIKNVYDAYSAIHIDTTCLKYKGVMRYALKYALWALELSGILTVSDEPRRGFGFSTKHIDFWQVRSELFKCLKADVALVDLNDTRGTISVRKIANSYSNNGITFGIIFSGDPAEVPILRIAVESIIEGQDLRDIPYEILVCGPAGTVEDTIAREFASWNVRYINYPAEHSGGRFLITKKKNYVIDQAAYSVVAISHARIKFTTGFASTLLGRRFDVLTPKILATIDGKHHRYLDFTLTGSYDTGRRNTAFVMSNEFLPDDVLYFMTRRVPYLDGGLSVFNKDKIGIVRYCEDLAWGEAEDVDLCGRLYAHGLLLDYAEDCICMSQTCKIRYTASPWQRYKNDLKLYLVRRGLL